MTTLPAAGTFIGQYELVEQIGTGGMATVFKARQAKLDRHVAIKIMHQIFLSDNNFLARFEREARIVARLDHPNVVPVYDYDDLNGVPYLVMKFIEGRTLKEILSDGPLPLDQILKIISAVASALTYAHSQGVLHRDVKPSNIIIDERGTPYLTDFGLARIAKAGESTMSADMMLGTPHYISPEQAQGSANLDARADVYSLGVVLYELIVGRTPFSGDTPYIIVHKHIYSEPPHPTDMNADIPLPVSKVILKAMEKQPDDRYATPDEMAKAFREAVEESGISSLPEDRGSVSQRAFTQLPSQPPVVRKTKEPEVVASTPTPIPGQAHKQAMDAVFAQVSTSFKDPKVISIPSPIQPEQPPAPPSIEKLFSQETLAEVVERFREAINDIREQIATGEIFQQLRSGAKDAMVEIRSHVEANGGKFEFNFGEGEKPANAAAAAIQAAVAAGSTANRARKTKVIQREWGTDDASIRHRVQDRVTKRRELIVHTMIYFFVAFIIFNGAESSIKDAITSALIDSPELQALTTLNVGLILKFVWGSALIAHALDVFYQTGWRIENRRRAIQTAMVQRFSENWMDVATDSEYKKVRNQVEGPINARKDFFQHFVVSIGLVLAVGAAWTPLQQTLVQVVDDADAIKFFETVPIPAVFAMIMAFTVVIHGIVVLFGSVFNDESKERAIEREMERERQMTYSMVKSKNEQRPAAEAASIRLTGDGEFTDSFIEDLNTQEAAKKKR